MTNNEAGKGGGDKLNLRFINQGFNHKSPKRKVLQER